MGAVDDYKITDPERIAKMDDLVTKHFGLIGWTIHTLLREDSNDPDLFSAGMMGLVKAARKYTSKVIPCKFSTVAVKYIKNYAITDIRRRANIKEYTHTVPVSSLCDEHVDVEWMDSKLTDPVQPFIIHEIIGEDTYNIVGKWTQRFYMYRCTNSMEKEAVRIWFEHEGDITLSQLHDECTKVYPMIYRSTVDNTIKALRKYLQENIDKC